MILEHLVDELATFLNEKNGVLGPSKDSKATVEEVKDGGFSGLRPMSNDLTPNKSAEMYELMRDEPEFAASGRDSRARDHDALQPAPPSSTSPLDERL